MRKVKYSIENNTVWANLYVGEVIMNFWGLYKGTTRRDCENWLRKYKEKKNGESK